MMCEKFRRDPKLSLLLVWTVSLHFRQPVFEFFEQDNALSIVP